MKYADLREFVAQLEAQGELKRIPVPVDTICVHGDTPGAVQLAARVRAALEQAGVVVQAIGAP